MRSFNCKIKKSLIYALPLTVMLSPISAIAGHVSPVVSPELNVVGQLDLELPGANVTDVWAYGDYAYLGTFDEGLCSLDITGVHIVNISNPAAPVKVGFVPAKPGTRNNDIKVAHIDTRFFTGEILVVSNEACGSPFIPKLHANGGGFIPGQGGLSIWDVTDPTNPKVLRQNYLDFGVHNTFIYQQGLNAYMLVVDDENIQDLTIVDITKPQSPKVIAVTGKEDWPDGTGIDADIAAEFGDSAATFLHDVWVQENNGIMIAYLSYWDAGLVLLDITDPANPTFLGHSIYADPDPLSGEKPAGDGHVAVPNVGGSRVLFGDEDFAAGTLTLFDFGGEMYPAVEGAFTEPTYLLPDASFSGPVHWTDGQGCTVSAFDRAAKGSDEVALIQRGTCYFSDKADNAVALGYAGFIVANDLAREDDGLVTMVAAVEGYTVNIPGYFIGYDTGEFMKRNQGTTLATAGVFDGYGYLRLLDVSDSANIVELDQFATEGVFVNPPIPGDRTIHNIVVDDGTRAYISWYNEGMRVVDFANNKLTEVAHFVDTGSSFWGVYLHNHPDGKTYILGSDRNTGLWIFENPTAKGKGKGKSKP